MAFLLLTLCLNVAVGAVLAGSDLVPEPCLQGPEFWCKDVTTAVECKREKYCWDPQLSLSLWEGLVEGDEAPAPQFKCTICTKIMKKLKKLAGDDPGEEKIDAAMKSLCGVVGRVLRGACIKMLRQFKDQIVEGLQNGDEPRDICVNINLCKSAAPALASGSDLVPESCLQGPEFWCKDVATAAGCKREEYCWELQWSSSLWEMTEENQAAAPRKRCSTCTTIMQKLLELAGDDPDDDKIDAAINSLCKAVGKRLSKTCKKIIKKFRDQIVEGLQNGDGAQDICVTVNMCKSTPPEIDDDGSW
ncbi:prosaposin-like [Hemicordylus capensis]|uniref:prosaposin-like n=1 Tax=Hemicordylus capensis TaxID=884348 RepID=UPI0023026FCE|nr:prosaposin-like [Hemicordylus capensis]